MKLADPRGIVLPEWKLIYYFIPKNASSTIKGYFAKQYGWNEGTGQTPHHFFHGRGLITAKQRRQYDGFRTFAVVRHRVDRLYSCYKSKIFPDGRGGKRLRDGVNAYVFGRVPGVKKNLTFSEFVEVITKVPHQIADRHFAEQTMQIADKEQIFPDVIVRFERLQADLMEKLGIDISGEPKRNQSEAHNPERVKDWRKVTDETTFRRCVEYYQRDFENFGYETDF